MDKGGVRQAEDFHTPSLSSSFAERSRAIRQRQEKLELSLDALWRTTERQECILRRLVIDTRQREWKKLLFSD
jgi:hypothetical protein